MNHILQPLLVRGLAPLAAIVIVLTLFGGAVAYHHYTGLNRWQSIPLGLLAVGLGIALAFYADNQVQYGTDRRFHHNTEPFLICAALLLPLLAVPFVVRLYRKWIGGQLSGVEKLPGRDGVRAWLTPGN